MANSEVSLRAIKEDFPGFCERIKTRLEVGAREYGDASFDRDPMELIEEIQQELLDVSGWSFIEWDRLERVKKRLQTLLSDKPSEPAKVLEFKK